MSELGREFRDRLSLTKPARSSRYAPRTPRTGAAARSPKSAMRRSRRR